MRKAGRALVLGLPFDFSGSGTSCGRPRRRHELGIRMALGAQLADLRTMVLRQGMLPVVLGLAAGVFASLLLGRLVAGLLFGVRAFDPLTFTCVAAVIIIVALVACYIPARRATRVDPMIALRYE